MSTGTVISYPIPPYQNLPIESQFYEPSFFFILNITLGITTTVQATVDMNYTIGQQVRLIIPRNSGCYQLNEITGIVLSLPDDDQVELNINSSRNVDAFIVTTEATQPQILAIGDINSGATNAQGQINQQTYIPGSFINISPL